MSRPTRSQIRKVDRRSQSRCADAIAKHRGDKVAIAKLDKTSMKNFADCKPKLTTVLQFGHWTQKKVNTVSQIDKSFLRMSWTTRLQICKLDRRSRSRCADSHSKHRGTQGCDCKVRQDIIQKVASKVKNSLQNVGDAKSRLQLYNVNLKVNVPRPPRGVEITK